MRDLACQRDALLTHSENEDDDDTTAESTGATGPPDPEQTERLLRVAIHRFFTMMQRSASSPPAPVAVEQMASEALTSHRDGSERSTWPRVIALSPEELHSRWKREAQAVVLSAALF